MHGCSTMPCRGPLHGPHLPNATSFSQSITDYNVFWVYYFVTWSAFFDFLACKLIDLNFIDHISSSLYLKNPTLIIVSPAFLKHRAVFGLSVKMYSKMTPMNTTFVEVVYGWALQWPLDQQGAESATIAAAQWSRQETVIKVMILSSKAGKHFLWTILPMSLTPFQFQHQSSVYISNLV